MASWKTTVDGYEAGHVYSASMGGQVTGRRAGTLADNGFTGAIILDDPLKPEMHLVRRHVIRLIVRS